MANVFNISSHSGYLKNIRRTAVMSDRPRVKRWVTWLTDNKGDAGVITELRLMNILSGGIEWGG